MAVLEEIGTGGESRQHPPARPIHGIEDRHVQPHRRRERINRGHLGQRQRQPDRAGRECTQRQGWRYQGRVEHVDRRPVGPSGRLVREGLGAAAPPARAGLVLPYGRVSVAHQTGARAHRYNLASLQAQVVIFEKEQVVSKLMHQRARPILAKVAAGVAEAVPDRAHPHLAGAVDHRTQGGRVGDRLSRDAANQGGGAHAVRGVNADVGGVPVLPVLKNGNTAKRGLTMGGLKEQFRGTGEIRLKLGHKARVVASVPL